MRGNEAGRQNPEKPGGAGTLAFQDATPEK